MAKISNWYIYGRLKGSTAFVKYLGYVRASSEESAKSIIRERRPTYTIYSATRTKR